MLAYLFCFNSDTTLTDNTLQYRYQPYARLSQQRSVQMTCTQADAIQPVNTFICQCSNAVYMLPTNHLTYSSIDRSRRDFRICSPLIKTQRWTFTHATTAMMGTNYTCLVVITIQFLTAIKAVNYFYNYFAANSDFTFSK